MEILRWDCSGLWEGGDRGLVLGWVARDGVGVG